jgi:AcrR family transcriptional regulator
MTLAGTREIGRHAVRTELARIAFDNFCLSGFDAVTFSDLSSAAGVSRSTFLRYFGTKEDVVLFAFDPVREVLGEAAMQAPGGTAEWRVLRIALEAALDYLVREVAHLPTLLDLIGRTPALCARLREKQDEWRRHLVDVLAERSGGTDVSLTTHVRTAAALEVLWIVLSRTAPFADDDLQAALDTAFGALVDV